MLFWTLSALVALVGALSSMTWLSQRDIERRYPPIGEIIELPGGNVHVLRKGAGVPVVLIHGASSNLREWTTSVFDAVAARHNAIAIDRPGHGWSTRNSDRGHDPRVQARILRRLFLELGIERPVLVGHSWGGTVVLAYALEYPDDIGGILFLSGVSHPWPGGIGWQHEIAAVPVIGTLFAWTLVTPGFLIRANAAIREVFTPDRPPRNYRDAAGTALYSRPANFVANALDLVHLKPIVSEMASDYGEIRAPLIALTGDQDGVIYTELHTPPLVAKVPGAELRVLKGVGHMPHHAAPDAVLDAIDRLVELGARRNRPKA